MPTSLDHLLAESKRVREAAKYDLGDGDWWQDGKSIRCKAPAHHEQPGGYFIVHAQNETVARMVVFARNNLETFEAEVSRLSADNKRMERVIEALASFAKSVHDNFDCDSDAHKYGTPCRCCEAKGALEALDE